MTHRVEISKDGRISIDLTIEDGGTFRIDISTLVDGDTVQATMEQTFHSNHVTIRGGVRE